MELVRLSKPTDSIVNPDLLYGANGEYAQRNKPLKPSSLSEDSGFPFLLHFTAECVSGRALPHADLSLGGSFVFRFLFPFYQHHSMPDTTQTITALHECYQQVTGIPIRLAVWERAFCDFLATGYTVDDFRLVLEHVKRENRRMSGAQFSLRLNTLLDFEYMRFDSLLGEALAHKRNRVHVTPRERILATRTGGVTETKTGDTAKAASAILKGIAASL